MGKHPVSSSDDEDEEMQKRIRSCVASGSVTPANGTTTSSMQDDGKQEELKHYQVRLQDMLHRHLDKTMDICSNDKPPAENVPEMESDECGGFQLFAKAPPGITVAPAPPPPGPLDENIKRKPYRHSLKRWRSRGKDALEQTAVDGELVKAEAEKALDKALSKWKANLQRKEEAVANEKKRIAVLKRERGESWLHSRRTA